MDQSWHTYHAVMHDLVPIFSRHNPEQESDGIGCRPKISVSASEMTNIAVSSTENKMAATNHNQTCIRNTSVYQNNIFIWMLRK